MQEEQLQQEVDMRRQYEEENATLHEQLDQQSETSLAYQQERDTLLQERDDLQQQYDEVVEENVCASINVSSL